MSHVDRDVRHLLTYWYDQKWQGEVFSPIDVAVAEDAGVYTADISHHRVQRFRLRAP